MYALGFIIFPFFVFDPIDLYLCLLFLINRDSRGYILLLHMIKNQRAGTLGQLIAFFFHDPFIIAKIQNSVLKGRESEKRSAAHHPLPQMPEIAEIRPG